MDALKEWLKPEVVWFVIGIALLLSEFMMPGLIVFFFGLGAFIVGVMCLIWEPSLNLQLVVFLVSSLISLALLRKWVASVFSGHIGGSQSGATNLEAFVGQKARVVRAISPKSGGKIELFGTQWEAEADGDIAEGAMVEVVGKDSLTLKVKAL